MRAVAVKLSLGVPLSRVLEGLRSGCSHPGRCDPRRVRITAAKEGAHSLPRVKRNDGRDRCSDRCLGGLPGSFVSRLFFPCGTSPAVCVLWYTRVCRMARVGALTAVFVLCSLLGVNIQATAYAHGAMMEDRLVPNQHASQPAGASAIVGGILLALGGSCKQPFVGGAAGTRPIPNTGVHKVYTNLERIAPFKVNVEPGNHFFVKLERASDSRPIIEAFVRAGESFEMDVPTGTFRLKYGSGSEWYGFGKCFGDASVGASYETSDQLLVFEIVGNRVSGHEVTLYEVYDGNFDTHEIPRENF